VIASDIFFNGRSAALARLALLHRLPGVYQVREFPVAGGLMSYGGSFAQSHSRAGVYAAAFSRAKNQPAIFHATGKRIRELPITPDRLL
jgi:hypothetical protein